MNKTELLQALHDLAEKTYGDSFKCIIDCMIKIENTK